MKPYERTAGLFHGSSCTSLAYLLRYGRPLLEASHTFALSYFPFRSLSIVHISPCVYPSPYTVYTSLPESAVTSTFPVITQTGRSSAWTKGAFD